MPPIINTPVHVALGVADTEIVAEVGASTTKRVFVMITNTDTVIRTFQLHRYDSGSAESAVQTNAIFWSRSIAPNSSELLEVSLTLVTGWKISGLASAANVVIVHVDDVGA